MREPISVSDALRAPAQTPIAKVKRLIAEKARSLVLAALMSISGCAHTPITEDQAVPKEHDAAVPTAPLEHEEELPSPERESAPSSSDMFDQCESMEVITCKKIRCHMPDGTVISLKAPCA